MTVNTEHSSVQKLYKAARSTFGGGRKPSEAEVAHLSSVLAAVRLEELGVAPDTETNSQQSRQRIQYQQVYEDEDVTIGIFSLPARAQLPLHNHPGMTVLSRVLYGDMHVLSYDWESTPGSSNLVTGPRRAFQVHDRILKAAHSPAALFPHSGGNVHEFTAVTPCAVLDVLAPPYDSHDPEKDCAYFRRIPDSASSTARPSAILQPCRQPADFFVASQHYRGIPVVPEG
ncbi:hypothetical protein WJX73_001587 [Symbiochloris irregularis]|uniref:cysteine dioxygenase n=1 Tax=Symbiochloris irregularis TaxID=706552 RepID=A0AAW1NHT1_9CHLO